MTHTRTGSFPIGFRRINTPWQKNLENVISFAKSNAFAGIDVGDLQAEQISPIFAAGLKVGSVDLKQPWGALASKDSGKRKEAVDAAAAHIRAAAKLGVRNFFTVVFPEGESDDRRKSFDLAVAGYAQLAQEISGAGARIVIEGYPGWAPHYAALSCTPEGYRAFFRETASEALMINFDPSHLIRMGIDTIRFLGEFANRVGHVHGKDTEIMEEQLYEYGNLQPATLVKPHGLGGHHWRYTIPGHGAARWGMLLRMLHDAGYDGMVSVELEDEHFNGTEDGEKRGLIASRDFLMSV